MRKASAICFVFCVAGCATTHPSRDSYRAASPALPTTGVVFVANGAGDARSASESLAQVFVQTNAGLEVQTFAWSRGQRRYLADQVDHDNHLVKGRELAGRVVAYRQLYPERSIYLLGHSAGCAVVLTAASQLPPESVQGIVLLSPSVCAAYDLRPALRASRGGIDAFSSAKDRWVLGLGMRIFGTTEEGCRVAAGRVGFTPVIEGLADAILYSKLRQHPWGPAVAWTGHAGGHFGNLDREFLRSYVLPLFNGR